MALIDESKAKEAVAREDAFALAALADQDSISRLKGAEELFALTTQRRQRSRLALAAQTAVGFVAIAGFFANAFQVYTSSRQQQRQMQVEQERWTREFQRASQADKYRAFFETSALATDTANADKRLVGYALLQEFVEDPDYNTKATLMLEEALSQELKRNQVDGLSDDTRAAVSAILIALSQTRDCSALAKTAHSINVLSFRFADTDDAVEAQEVFAIYVRGLIGRALAVCKTADDFKAVRKPLRDTLMKHPILAARTPPLTAAKANTAISALLRDLCFKEEQTSGASDCPKIRERYAEICKELSAGKDAATETGACEAMTAQAPDGGSVDAGTP